MFNQTVSFRTSPEVTVSLLSDLEALTRHHPLVLSVERLPAPEGVDKAYKVVDRVRLLGKERRVTYTAFLTQVGDLLLWTARAPCGVTVQTSYLVEEVLGGSLVTEVCEVSGPPGLAWLSEREARRAHQEALRGLARIHETQNPPR